MKKGRLKYTSPLLKNSSVIQVELASIQNNTDRLTQKSICFFVIIKIQKAAAMVGNTMIVPKILKSIAQHKSLTNHRSTWKFSITFLFTAIV